MEAEIAHPIWSLNEIANLIDFIYASFSWPRMSFFHTSHRMIFRTRLTDRWAQLGGVMPFRRHRHRLTARQRRAQFLLETILWALLLLWSALLSMG